MADEYDWNELWKDKPTPIGNVTPLPRPASADISAYANAALLNILNELRATPEGARNHTLNKAAFRVGQLIAGGEIPQSHATDMGDLLAEAARDIGLDAREIMATLRSGINAGQKHPSSAPPRTINGFEEVDDSTISPTFWDARDVLQHIRDFAYARMCSPWAVLGTCLLRALAVIPAHVVLPPLIGGYGSLNLFVALVGSSGQGKGAAESAAVDCIDFTQDIYTAPVGSGEGIAHQYAHRDRTGITRDRDSVLFTVSEVDTLTALGSRQGSTLLSQLRSAFSGERLGFGYADSTKRIPIERHTYRLGMIVGVQPERAGSILYDKDGGTPQRFIWLPANDPKIEPYPAPAPPQWVIDKQTFLPGRDMFHVLPIPELVEKTIRENHAARGRGEGEALDGHALFAREKVAQALAFLDRRRVMTEEDWQLSDVIMTLSDITRKRIIHRLDQQIEQADTRRAQREAHRAIHVAETVSEATIKRVAARVSKLVSDAGEMSWSELRRRVAQRDREHFDEVIERLIAAGQIRVSGEESSRIVHHSPKAP